MLVRGLDCEDVKAEALHIGSQRQNENFFQMAKISIPRAIYTRNPRLTPSVTENLGESIFFF